MNVVVILIVAVVVLFGGGHFYSRFIARSIGEDPRRPTPAVVRADGVDYVPTPTPVVFAHHFASIAGAGPIIGPVIAIVYGWMPAVLWVILGGVLIGAVHDYLATYMAMREGGQSIATIARRVLGKDAFVALTIMLVVMLALVCAAFLNLSAKALTSTLPFDRIELDRDQTLFRVVGNKVVIGGIASMSVILITAVAPLLGWLYIKKKVSVWKCSLFAVVICAASITIGLFRPVAFAETTTIGPWTFTGQQVWIFLLSAYVLVAAGLPVWIFLQSRDFINVHILYVGMIGLLATLVVAGFRPPVVGDPLPAVNIEQGTEALGWFWPGLFIVIACGAVSGFHSLCAGGTTCKQLASEKAARRIGYNSMLLESFLAVCVIGALVIGASKAGYLADVHPKLAGIEAKANAVLGFATALGWAVKQAFGAPVAVGALAGMVLLEGFLVTTLDTAVRLTRYLLEEIWRALFERFDVFAREQAAAPSGWGSGDETPAGAGGVPIAVDTEGKRPGPPRPTSGMFRWMLLLMRQYWFNSAIAVGITLSFALTGGVTAIWKIFATSNQLLAGMGLSLAALWLLRQGRRVWFALVPGLLMLATTCTNLVLLTISYLQDPGEHAPLLSANIVISAITLYLLFAGVRTAREHFRGETASR